MSEKRVLIIEDDPDLALLVHDSLTRAGYDCRVTSDSVQGMSAARQFKPDIVVLDYMLPGGGGPMVHQALRSDKAPSPIPIVLLTSVPENEVSRAIDMDGHTYYLGKPYGRRELLQIVEQAILEDGHGA